MIDVAYSGFKLGDSEDDEFSALGGIRWDQIEAWMPIVPEEKWFIGAGTVFGTARDEKFRLRTEEAFLKEYPAMNWTMNKDYVETYEPYTASGGQPQLAGDEENVEKYKEKTLEQYAIEFMDKNGGPVGWKGAFPLLNSPVSPASGGNETAGPASRDGDAGADGLSPDLDAGADGLSPDQDARVDGVPLAQRRPVESASPAKPQTASPVRPSLPTRTSKGGDVTASDGFGE